MACVFLSGYGQVQLEQSYTISGTLTEIDEGEFKYFFMDVPLQQCRLYNEDFSLYKTISVTVPGNYYLYDMKFVSRRIFDLDDNIELLYTYIKEETVDTETVYRYGLKIIDENGEVLLSLNDGGYAELKQGSEGYKLLAYQYIWYDYYYLVYTNIYSIGGNLKSVPLRSESGLRLFPNPVSRNLHMAIDPSFAGVGGKITITDLAGRQLYSESTKDIADVGSLSMERLPAGAYIVNVSTEKGSFPGEIIEKK